MKGLLTRDFLSGGRILPHCLKPSAQPPLVYQAVKPLNVLTVSALTCYIRRKRECCFCNSLAKFRNPLVLILLVASAVLALTGDVTSFIIISVIVLISVTLDFVQEHRAGQAVETLRQSVAVRVQVLRDGKPLEIPLAELVPGDIALLAAGDLVPGDGRVLEAKDFFVNQALLTGEPYPVEKIPGELPEEAEILSADNTVLLGHFGNQRNGKSIGLPYRCKYSTW